VLPGELGCSVLHSSAATPLSLLHSLIKRSCCIACHTASVPSVALLHFPATFQALFSTPTPAKCTSQARQSCITPACSCCDCRGRPVGTEMCFELATSSSDAGQAQSLTPQRLTTARQPTGAVVGYVTCGWARRCRVVAFSECFLCWNCGVKQKECNAVSLRCWKLTLLRKHVHRREYAGSLRLPAMMP
jgi:hypothetical protein